MKLKTEHKLIFGGVLLSLIIIYLTKIDNTVAPYQWMYSVGQFFFFNLAISFLSSVIFYAIVVYMPEKRKKNKFFFQMGMDTQGIHLKGWSLFYYLICAAKMRDQFPDTGKLTGNDVEKCIAVVNLDTVHTFEHLPGSPKITFREYLEIHRKEMNDSMVKTMSIPCEDLDLFWILMNIQRTGIITGHYIQGNNKEFGKIDILGYFILLRSLEHHFNTYYAPIILNVNKLKKVK